MCSVASRAPCRACRAGRPSARGVRHGVRVRFAKIIVLACIELPKRTPTTPDIDNDTDNPPPTWDTAEDTRSAWIQAQGNAGCQVSSPTMQHSSSLASLRVAPAELAKQQHLRLAYARLAFTIASSLRIASSAPSPPTPMYSRVGMDLELSLRAAGTSGCSRLMRTSVA